MRRLGIGGVAITAAIVLAAAWYPSGTSAGVAGTGSPTADSRPIAADTDTDTGTGTGTGVATTQPATIASNDSSAAVDTTWPEPDAISTHLVLVGDSLAHETSGLIAYLTSPKAFIPKFWGGTAPCDWVDNDLQANASTVVVISFTGNSLTPCMADGAGGFLQHDDFAAEYRGSLEVLVTRARRAGAQVVLVGQPQRAPSFDHADRVDAINAMLQEFAARWKFVSYVDAGAALETATGQFAERLPCTVFDVDCAADGQTVVRGDGVHFCPVINVNPCPVHSSGALRFALAIADAANSPARFD